MPQTTLKSTFIVFILYLLAGLLLTGGNANADNYNSGGPIIPEQAAYDVLYYDLYLAVDVNKREISGSNTITFQALEVLPTFVFDLDNLLTIDSVTTQTARLTITRKSAKVWAEMPQPVEEGESATVTVFYHGSPRVAPNSPWSGGFDWKQTPGGSPWVGVSCQNEGADIWWPCKDHPSDEPDSMRINITVPENLMCVSNGRMDSISQKGDQKTFHWFVSTPINNYGVSIYIAPYEKIKIPYESVTGDSFPVSFWFLPENRERHTDFVGQIPQHLRFLEETLGPYPFRIDKYGVAEAPYLGMEHQSIIAYGNYSGNSVFGYDQGFDALHFHELCHEWWGNMLTARDWKDFWIHEGFATYMEALYAGYLNGERQYFSLINHFKERISNRVPVAFHESKTTQEMYSGDLYYKGAAILHSLRFVLGEKDFFEFLQRVLYPTESDKFLLNGEQCRFISSEEVQATAEKIYGKPLDWFFNIYLYRAELPVLQVSRKGSTLRLEWITADGLDFPMPVPIKILRDYKIVEMDNNQAIVQLPAPVMPQVDPDGWVLKDVAVVSNVQDNMVSMPGSPSLFQNYPNPFNSETIISFYLPENENVTIDLYNSRGEFVLQMVHEEFMAGYNQIEWEAGNIASGTYVYKLTAGNFVESKKLTLIK